MGTWLFHHSYSPVGGGEGRLHDADIKCNPSSAMPRPTSDHDLPQEVLIQGAYTCTMWRIYKAAGGHPYPAFLSTNYQLVSRTAEGPKHIRTRPHLTPFRAILGWRGNLWSVPAEAGGTRYLSCLSIREIAKGQNPNLLLLQSFDRTANNSLLQ